MANAAIAYLNLADLGRVTASSQATAMPISNVQNPHVSVRWRSLVNDAFFVANLQSAQSVDTILVRGVTASATATVRVRVCSVDPTGVAGDLGDTGVVASGSMYFDADYDAIVYRLAVPVSAQYIRVDITDSAGTYVEAGRLFVGLSTQFAYNYNWGWSIGYTDRSVKVKSRGGQTLVLPDNSYRTLTIDFEWVSSAQRYGIVETVDRVNGQSVDVCLIADTSSTNLARDTIWGMVVNLSPVTNPSLSDIFGKQYQIEERL